MVKRPFEQWLFEDVELTFGIERKKTKTLHKWLYVEPQEKILSKDFEKLRQALVEGVEIWNEDELKMMFIAPFLLLFDFNHLPNYRVFTQRYFSLQTEEVEANGKVEWLVATGKQIPREPFFFLAPQSPKGKQEDIFPLWAEAIGSVNISIFALKRY